jgi:pimeloyl-ACP methyl ester carboxylesterase
MISRKLVVSLLLAGLALAFVLTTLTRAAQREAAALAASPATGQFVEIEGARVHYTAAGQGLDLILIHGASGNLNDFNNLIPQLAPHYHVIAFDRPGLGYSDPIASGQTTLRAQAEHLAKAAALLGAKNPLVLGQSYGGAVALAWAAYAPEKPRALILVSAASLPWPGKLDIWYRLTSNPLGAALLPPLVTAYMPAATLNDIVKSVFAPDTMPPDYARTIGAELTIRRQTLRINAAQVNGLRAELVAMAPLYPGLTLPVELVHGSADTIVPLAIHSRPLAAILPNATLTVIKGAGHMPHHSHPAAIIAAIGRADASAALR